MSGQIQEDQDPAKTALGVGSAAQTSQEPKAPNPLSLDQMVEDAISKATAQAPLSTSTTPLIFSNQFNQSQYLVAPQSHGIPSWNPPGISIQSIHQMMAAPQLPPSSSSQNPTSFVDPSTRLPQDILHILESDFTSDSADTQARKDHQISRVAEELRVKVRLSRYRRVRDQFSDSEDEDGEHGEGSESSDDEDENDSVEDQNENGKLDPQGEDEADLIDGSGDEEEEREKNNKALAKLRMEIEQIIGSPQTAGLPQAPDGDADPIDGCGDEEEEREKGRLKVEVEKTIGSPQGAGLSEEVKKTATESGDEEKLTTAAEPDLQTGIPHVSGSQEDLQTKTCGEIKDGANDDTTEHQQATTQELVVNKLDKSVEFPPTIACQKSSETCTNEQPNFPPQTATSTTLSTTIAVDVTPTLLATSSLSKSQVTKPQKKKPPPKKRMAEPADSGEESEDEGQGTSLAGPTTANELKEPPSEVTEVPFARVSDEDMKSISAFGTITSLIGNVLVIQGTAGIAYDRVLDEGTLVCQKDGMVIGKIFETFGSVTNPYYSIRLPKHILACTDRNDAERLDLSPGLLLYFIPTHSNFVFTAELKAQPKGTDASNFYDEEPQNADEVEFSDDEAEAAYRQACKLAKKNVRDLNGNLHHQNRPRDNHSKQNQRNSVQVSENGRRMFVKMTSHTLNYGTDDGDSQGPSATVESDYSFLQRPKEPTASDDTPTSAHPSSRQSSAQRSRGKKRASTGRDRNRKRFPPQQSHPSASQPAKGEATITSLPAGNRGTDVQPGKTANPVVMNQPSSVAPNLNSNHPQTQAGGQGSMIMMPGQMNMNFAGLAASNGNQQNMHSSHAYMPMWNMPNGARLSQNHMMMPMMMNHNMYAGMSSYNPHFPSHSSPSSSPNGSFQFGYQNFNNSNPTQFAPASQQLSAQNLPSNPSFQFLQQSQMPNQHGHTQSQTQNNQSSQLSPNSSNLGHFNPWFYRPP